MKLLCTIRNGLFFLSAVGLMLSGALTPTQGQTTTPVLQLRLAETEPGDGLTKVESDDGKSVYVQSETIIGEGDIQSVAAKRVDGQRGKIVHIRLTEDAGKRLGEVSAANLKKTMAILYNGSLMSAPVIQSELGRNVVISGNFTEEEVDEMVEALTPGPSIASFENADFDKFSARLDRAFENRIFSGTVLIAVDGKIVFEKSVGYENADIETPFSENSSFRLASVSKQFTAMGIMLLKEEGKLDFDDDITEHLPTLSCKGVTIRHLLHHTGGLTDYMGLFAEHWDKKTDEAAKMTAFNKDLVKLFAQHKPAPDFDPGERYQYSNTGYVLLGSIIEAASGQKIQQFFKSRIFEPLKMDQSFVFSVDESEFKPASRVFGFAWQGDGQIANDWHYLNGMVGDGGIYASARDMLKWDQALYGESLVSQSTLDEAFTPGKLNNGKETDYGFGWLVERSKSDGLIVSHGGAWVGFRTSIERSVDRKLTVIVLSNNSTSNIDQVVRAISELQD